MNKSRKGYVIRQTIQEQNRESYDDTSLFWSNEFGWCEGGFDVFTEEHRNTLNLPLEGEWVEVRVIGD